MAGGLCVSTAQAQQVGFQGWGLGTVWAVKASLWLSQALILSLVPHILAFSSGFHGRVYVSSLFLGTGRGAMQVKKPGL